MLRNLPLLNLLLGILISSKVLCRVDYTVKKQLDTLKELVVGKHRDVKGVGAIKGRQET